MREIALFEKGLPVTPIEPLNGEYGSNRCFVKRDDLLPFSFGGNKVRKAAEFYKGIKKNDVDMVMTYGSNSSNHCRITANMAAAMGIACHIISPEENREILYNTQMVEQFGGTIETCPVSMVAKTIENRKKAYIEEGRKPYFITGGGHGNPGTRAYVKAYQEILDYEKMNDIRFDYIFHASGTGTTQAGLVCGKLLYGGTGRIIGISIAREAGRGRQVVKDSIREYLGERFDRLYTEEELTFTDAYRLEGYGKYDNAIMDTIQKVMNQEGIPLDSTYVGKAFHGMCQYLEEHEIKDKNILFIHTGGTPLYFDYLSSLQTCGKGCL